MNAKITFPELPRVRAELPLYVATPPKWTPERVAECGARLGVRGAVVDAGPWFVLRDGASTLEVYQASHSLRLTRDDFDAEGRGAAPCTIARDGAVTAAERFHETLGRIAADADVHSVSELTTTMATKGGKEETRVVGMQVNYRYRLDDLPLVGPGAKAQVTIGRDGQVGQAYRFWREVTRAGARPALPPERACERFTSGDRFAELPRGATVRVDRVELGLLCLPPTEVQGVLMPAYVLRGEVHTELLPEYRFITYVAAVEVDDADAKRHRWPHAQPSLLAN